MAAAADNMNGADLLGSHGRGSGGIWDRIPLFWRFQLGGWLAFTVFSFPSKWMMLETIPASVLVSLYVDTFLWGGVSAGTATFFLRLG